MKIYKRLNIDHNDIQMIERVLKVGESLLSDYYAAFYHHGYQLLEGTEIDYEFQYVNTMINDVKLKYNDIMNTVVEYEVEDEELINLINQYIKDHKECRLGIKVLRKPNEMKFKDTD